MKKFLLCFLSIIITASFLIACGNPDTNSLENVSKDYTLEQAKEDGCMVIENGKLTAGQAVFDQFLADTADGKEATLRIVDRFDLSISDGLTAPDALFISDIRYQDNTYTVQYYEDGKLTTKTFQYLIRDTFEAPSPHAAFTDGITWVLCNDESLTEQDIFASLVSSDSNDSIPFHTVYNRIPVQRTAVKRTAYRSLP